MREFYPEIEPFQSGRLKVSDLHEIYFEQVGNPKGKPVVFLHGGPGGGIHSDHRRYFDPSHYRVILFDQRGCGQSTPYAELKENTTWDLVGRVYLSNHFLVYFNAQNIFDREFAGLDATGTPDDLRYNPQPGRYVRLGVNYNMN